MVTGILGRLERLMLLLGTIEFSVNDSSNDFKVIKDIEMEGFMKTPNGILVEVFSWNDSDFSNKNSIKVLYPSNEAFIEFLLDGDLIPPESLTNKDVKLPKISLVTPVYNSERFFERYLEQLSKIEYPKELLEIIIIDDGSKRKKDVKEFMLRISEMFPIVKFYENEENMGVFYSKMRGANLSTGKYITFWDIDDFYDPLQIKLLAIHNELLMEYGIEKFLVSSPSIVIDERTLKPLMVWKTSYKKTFQHLIESMLTFRGTVSITSSLLYREHVVKAYKILVDKYKVLELVPKLSVPEDTLLVNQMMMEGFIKKTFPISYTGRGHVRGISNTSGNLKRRVKEIPISIAIIIEWLCRSLSDMDAHKLFLTNWKTVINSIKIYNKFTFSFIQGIENLLIFYNLHAKCPEVFKIFEMLKKQFI